MRFENKTILIISPQAWGQMFISKHHYAITLANMGNRVYFLNPPEQHSKKRPGQIDISRSSTHHNLLLIEHALNFPFILKFHAKKLFHLLMRFHVKNILDKIESPVDIVWSFDQGNLFPFRFFGEKPFKIFQPVDEPADKEAIKAAEGAQLIISVTREILSKYKDFSQPRHLVNHGIGEDFLLPVATGARQKNIHVGLSGNLLREDIDREILLKIIAQNPDIVFECWGTYAIADSTSKNKAALLFIHKLQQLGVLLHGPTGSQQLACELRRMDAFLICYDVQKDQSKGTNYHKIMEFLSIGKVIIANNVSSYYDKPELVQMIKSRANNDALPRFFKKITQNLDYYNSPGLQEQRRKFAVANTYVNQVGRIQEIIGEVYAMA